jgi:hypothetical protein
MGKFSPSLGRVGIMVANTRQPQAGRSEHRTHANPLPTPLLGLSAANGITWPFFRRGLIFISFPARRQKVI